MNSLMKERASDRKSAQMNGFVRVSYTKLHAVNKHIKTWLALLAYN